MVDFLKISTHKLSYKFSHMLSIISKSTWFTQFPRELFDFSFTHLNKHTWPFLSSLFHHFHPKHVSRLIISWVAQLCRLSVTVNCLMTRYLQPSAEQFSEDLSSRNKTSLDKPPTVQTLWRRAFTALYLYNNNSSETISQACLSGVTSKLAGVTPYEHDITFQICIDVLTCV